nr:cation transporting ATPase C-terminal domain-containing protein [Enterococcus mundtii]
MLGCNISALTIVLISLILGWGAPVTAIQLLIIKVVADGIPGFSLSVEPAEEKIWKNNRSINTIAFFHED